MTQESYVERVLSSYTTKLIGTAGKNPDGVPRQLILKECRPGQKLTLKHQAIPQDLNAVQVLTEKGKQIGWLNKEFSQLLAPALDAGTPIEAEIREISNSAFNGLECTIELSYQTANGNQQKPEEVVYPATSVKKCGICGAQVGDKETRCRACGKTICVNCGNPIGTGVTKCPKCGESTPMGGIQALGFFLFFVGVLVIILWWIFFA